MSDKEKKPSVFPQELPFEKKKDLDHGVIIDVVQSEIAPPPASKPAEPHNGMLG